MKLGIMQPYFFPYLGYFTLINYVDKFILFDTPQYIDRGWINRNRILNHKGEVRYITVPVQKSSRDAKIKDIKIDHTKKWKESILGSITAYKRKAPYYTLILDLLTGVFDAAGEDIAGLDYLALKAVCEYLDIKTPIEIYSEMDITLEQEISAPDEWALFITKKLGYSEYVNPPGGQSFFKKEKYTQQHIELKFIESMLPSYIQRIGHYEKGLSILDVMMFCDKNTITDMLYDFKIS